MPLYRSRRNSMIAGVCGGIAEWLGWSPTWVRLLYILISHPLHRLPRNHRLHHSLGGDAEVARVSSTAGTALQLC